MNIEKDFEEEKQKIEKELSEKENILLTYENERTSENTAEVYKVKIDEIRQKIQSLKQAFLKRSQKTV